MALLGAPMFRCQILVVGVGFQSAFWEWENLNTIYAKEVVGHYKLYTLTIWLDAQTKDIKNPIHVKLLFQISLFFMFSAYVFFFASFLYFAFISAVFPWILDQAQLLHGALWFFSHFKGWFSGVLKRRAIQKTGRSKCCHPRIFSPSLRIIWPSNGRVNEPA